MTETERPTKEPIMRAMREANGKVVVYEGIRFKNDLEAERTLYDEEVSKEDSRDLADATSKGVVVLAGIGVIQGIREKSFRKISASVAFGSLAAVMLENKRKKLDKEAKKLRKKQYLVEDLTEPVA